MTSRCSIEAHIELQKKWLTTAIKERNKRERGSKWYNWHDYEITGHKSTIDFWVKHLEGVA